MEIWKELKNAARSDDMFLPSRFCVRKELITMKFTNCKQAQCPLSAVETLRTLMAVCIHRPFARGEAHSVMSRQTISVALYPIHSL